MRKLVLALALAAPVLFAAAPGQLKRPAPVVAVYPLRSNGALIQEDSGTVAHVLFAGGQLVDTKANAWTMGGTVPQAQVGPFTFLRGRAGPFSAANYYQLASEALNIAQFSVCAVYQMTDVSANNVFVIARDAGATNGWVFMTSATGIVSTATYGAGSGTVSTGNVSLTNGVNVACGGRLANGNIVAKLNLGTYVTSASTATTVATGSASRIGVSATGSSPLTTGGILELWFSTTAPSDALFTSIQRQVFGHYAGSKGELLTVTRTTPATYTGSDGALYTAPAGVLRITAQGALIEPAATNYLLNSGDLTTASWTKRGAGGVTTDGTKGPDGVTNASLLSGIGATGVDDVYQPIASGLGATVALAQSFWIKKVSSSGTLRASNAQGGSNGYYLIDLSLLPAGWSRITTGALPAGVTLPTAFTSTAGGAGGLQFYATAGGPLSFYIAGTQQEVGSFSTSYIATAGAAATRNGDAVSVSKPASQPADPYCFSASVRVDNRSSVLAAAGGYAAVALFGTAWPGANEASIWFNSANFSLDTRDNASSSKSSSITGGWGTNHRVIACASGGTLTTYRDGASLGSSSGAGTGVLSSMSGTLTLGSLSAAGASALSGYLSDVRLCKSGTPQVGCR